MQKFERDTNAYQEYRSLVGLARAISHSGHLAAFHLVEHHIDVARRAQPQQ